MRLHRLTLSAFGPYPRTETVDFDALGVDGLFLLHGDTGAGKTTVLDGVAFALFGTVPGARGEVRRLRCDYAAPDIRTEVVLEFTVQGARLRITRSPEYRRPKRRGDGVTTEPAKVSLVWCGPPPGGHQPEGLTRADEVGRTVQGLLGMTAAQFFQVVLLPQGEFARFLRSDTTEREQLLEKLFGTQRFADLERWFRDHRTESRARLERQRAAVDALLSRLSQAAGDDIPDAAARTTRDWADRLRIRVAEESAAAAEADTLARRAVDAAEAELRRRAARMEQVRRVRQATAELAEDDAERPTRDEWAAEVASARRAAPVLAAHLDRQRADALRVDAVTAEAAARERVVALGEDPDLNGVATVAALRRQVGELRGTAGGLGELVAEAERQAAEVERAEALAVERTALDAALAESATEFAAVPADLSRLQAELDTARAAAVRVDALVSRLAELDGMLAEARRLPEITEATAEARDAATRATETHQGARDRLLDLRQRRLNGMAAELAAGLRAGQPCAVCGSAEHPAPAAAVDPVTEADEAAAVRAEQSAHRARQSAEQAAREAVVALESLRARLGERDLAQLDADRREVAEDHRAAAGAAADQERRAAALGEREARRDQLAARIADGERRRAAVDAEHAALAASTAARRIRLDEARDGHADVQARRGHLTRLADAVESLADRRAERSAADTRLAEQQRTVAELAEQAGFGTAADAVAAARPEAVVADRAARLAAAEHRAAAARAVLDEPELAEVAAGAEVDLPGAERTLAEARRQADHALVAAKSAEARADAVRGLADRLADAWQRLAPQEARFAELDALTDVVNGRGQNSQRMALRSYVLAARLQEVAAAANGRLRRMSQGRYSFVHSDAAGARGTRGGLGLDVRDAYSGQDRPTKTLSGGESFLASLSLALGLADVVAAETGGALLDTLFVDEGFGTLDADTLDLVMDTLDELRAGGRVVGLVSHVEELRQRIPIRLRVRKARTGSTLELTAG